jgi:hypothetical protein
MLRFRHIVLTACVFSLAQGLHAFEAEDYEEPAGLCFAVHGSSGAWDFGFEDGTWLVNTPIMGQAFLTALRLDKTSSWYGGIGMVLRLMPRWSAAPFVGAGGGYYHSWASENSEIKPSDSDRIAPESFWGGIAEAGMRLELPDGQHFFDMAVRYMWNSADSRLNYAGGGIAYGQRW